MNIKDLSKNMGLSVSTISKALNNKPDVSDNVKKRVISYAKQVGYTPNPLAQRLSHSKSNTIGVFILSRGYQGLKENYVVQFLDGITARAYEAGYDIHLFTTIYNSTLKQSYMKLCYDRKLEGAIFLGLNSTDSNRNELENSRIPVAVVDSFLHGKKLFTAQTNSEKGIEQAIIHAINRGHKNIGFIKGCDDVEVFEERYNSFCTVTKKHKCYNEHFIINAYFDRESGYEAAKTLISENRVPTLLMGANDFMIIGALKAFREQGFSIPERISFIGFDDIPSCQDTYPALTTVKQNSYKIGESCVNYILGLIPENHIKIDPELIIRESVYNQKEGKND